jgi:hypothetical protein
VRSSELRRAESASCFLGTRRRGTGRLISTRETAGGGRGMRVSAGLRE